LLKALEGRIDNLEERMSKLEKGKGVETEETSQVNNKPPELEIELFNTKKDATSFEGLICNEDKKINTIKILTRIKIQDYEIETLALVDSGCTKSIINKCIFPQK